MLLKGRHVPPLTCVLGVADPWLGVYVQIIAFFFCFVFFKN